MEFFFYKENLTLSQENYKTWALSLSHAYERVKTTDCIFS
jgi:hypothetical protein